MATTRKPTGSSKGGPSKGGPKKPTTRGFADKPKRTERTAPSFSREERSSTPRRAAPRRDGDERRDTKRSFDKPAGERRTGGDRRFAERRQGEERRRDDRAPARSGPRSSFGDKPAGRSSEGRSFEHKTYDRKPREDGDFKPRRPREEGDFKTRREYKPREEGGRSSFGKKEFGDKRSFDRKPFGDKKSFGDRKPRDKFEKPEAGAGAAARKGHEQMLYGVHAVVAALENKQRTVTAIWATETAAERIAAVFDKKRHPAITTVNKFDVERLLPEGAVHQGLAIAVEPLAETFLSDILSAARVANAARQVIVVLDEVTDPHNVGAVMRSMAMFGAKNLIVHKYNAPTVTGVMAKTATGAVEHVAMTVVTNLAAAIEELQIAGFYILGLDEKATVKLTEVPHDRHIVLVFGAEGEGLRAKTRSVCDAIASIPSLGPIASLNVSNAAAITLYEVTREG